jgi:hypothetical protein
MSPERKNFTQAEAQAQVGKVVRSLQEFASVPQGTLADVIATDPMGTSKPVFGPSGPRPVLTLPISSGRTIIRRMKGKRGCKVMSEHLQRPLSRRIQARTMSPLN